MPKIYSSSQKLELNNALSVCSNLYISLRVHYFLLNPKRPGLNKHSIHTYSMYVVISILYLILRFVKVVDPPDRDHCGGVVVAQSTEDYSVP